MSWKEASEQILFSIQKGTDSGIAHKYIKIDFNQNIGRYDGLGELNIFTGGHSPEIELCNIFIWEYVKSVHLSIRIFIDFIKWRGTIMINYPYYFSYTCQWRVMIKKSAVNNYTHWYVCLESWRVKAVISGCNMKDIKFNWSVQI